MSRETSFIEYSDQILLQQEFRAIPPKEKALCMYVVAAHTLNPLSRRKAELPELYGRMLEAPLRPHTQQFLSHINGFNPQVYTDPVWNEDSVTQGARAIIGPIARRFTPHVLHRLTYHDDEEHHALIFHHALQQAIEAARGLQAYAIKRVYYEIPPDGTNPPKIIDTLSFNEGTNRALPFILRAAFSGILLGSFDETTYRVERNKKATSVTFKLNDEYLQYTIDRLKKYQRKI